MPSASEPAHSVRRKALREVGQEHSANPSTTSAPQTAITPMNASGPASESAAWLVRDESPHRLPRPADHGLAHDPATVRVEQGVEHVAQRDQDEQGTGGGDQRSDHHPPPSRSRRSSHLASQFWCWMGHYSVTSGQVGRSGSSTPPCRPLLDRRGEVRTRRPVAGGTLNRSAQTSCAPAAQMPDRLTPLDATFLELEQEDDCAHMHIGAALVFDPRPDGSVPTVEALRANLDARLGQLPRYRHKLSEPRTGGLRWPAWRTTIASICRRTSGTRRYRRPATSPRCEWLGDYWSHRLDRARPLWEVVLVDGLAGGRWRCHQDAPRDGRRSRLDRRRRPAARLRARAARPRPAPAPKRGREPGQERSRTSRVVGALRWAPEHLERAARYGADITIHPRKAAEILQRSRATVELLAERRAHRRIGLLAELQDRRFAPVCGGACSARRSQGDQDRAGRHGQRRRAGLGHRRPPAPARGARRGFRSAGCGQWSR